MSQEQFKLQNLVITEDYDLDENFRLSCKYTRDCEPKKCRYDYEQKCYYMKEGSEADFFTYLNTFSIQKWKKYTYGKNFTLNIEAKGKFVLRLVGQYLDNGSIMKETYLRKVYDCKEKSTISIDIEEDIPSLLVGFQIEAMNEVRIYSGNYVAQVDSEHIQPVDIVVSTTTFNQERFVKANIHLVQQNFLNSNEAAAKHFRFQIVDNGRTLDPEELETKSIKVFPNINTGGAGGFTRGMIESLQSEQKPTHIILMDDDVKILPESFVRTYALLSILRPEYDRHFISGAMLFLERPWQQHEDVGYVKGDGSFGPRKPPLDLRETEAVLTNEVELADLNNSYAGWWYCCIPTKTMDLNDLPLPLFIRGDDVEYSVKQNAKFITLAGICIWHKGFVSKYNAALELYLVHRNSMITQAISGVYENMNFMARIDGLFWKELRCFSYQGCELLLDAIEDYLIGPSLLETPQGERIIKEKAAKNEKMQPLENFSGYGILFENEIRGLYDVAKMDFLRRMLYYRSHNFHKGPKRKGLTIPSVIPYDWLERPATAFRKNRLLALNPATRTAAMRVMDKVRYKELIERRKRLFERYQNEGPAIARQYHEAGQKLRSLAFWTEYLGL